MPAIGIDLGTTNSLIAVFEDGAPRLLGNRLGGNMTPSVVALDDNGLLVGQTARDRAITEPKTSIATFKRMMGTKAKIHLGPHVFTPPELSALVLRALKEDAEAELGTTVDEAVISVPAYFNQFQREATQTAARLAGLTPLRLINEPTAAALTYGLQDREGESQFLVFDLGGGTFDVTVLEHFDGVMEVKASSGDAHLGGEDFTNVVVDLLADRAGLNVDSLSRQDQARLQYYAEQAKQQLSSDDTCSFSFEMGKRLYGITISPRDFEAAADPLITRLLRPIHHCLYDTTGAMRRLDRVIFVGGATRMPLVRRLIAKHLQLFPETSMNPDHVVALGAAIQAGLIKEDRALDDVVMTDVSPFSLGIRSGEGRGRGQVNDLFSPIIDRNTPLPASREERYQTVADRQKMIGIDVYQGEAVRVTDNILLGRFDIAVPPAPAGEESVTVRITTDPSGLVEVIATVVSTGLSETMVINTQDSRLSEDEIRDRLAALDNLKRHPRKDELNIATLNRINRLYEMTVGDDRNELREMYARFTSALERQIPEEIAELRVSLGKVLDNIDRFYVS